jgi:hypothetical protein
VQSEPLLFEKHKMTKEHETSNIDSVPLLTLAACKRRQSPTQIGTTMHLRCHQATTIFSQPSPQPNPRLI